eukprot:237969-Chlamydomonas_euryale.AAC.4
MHADCIATGICGGTASGIPVHAHALPHGCITRYLPRKSLTSWTRRRSQACRTAPTAAWCARPCCSGHPTAYICGQSSMCVCAAGAV